MLRGGLLGLWGKEWKGTRYHCLKRQGRARLLRRIAALRTGAIGEPYNARFLLVTTSWRGTDRAIIGSTGLAESYGSEGRQLPNAARRLLRHLRRLHRARRAVASPDPPSSPPRCRLPG